MCQMNSRNTSINLHVQPPAAPSNHDDDDTTVGGSGWTKHQSEGNEQLIKLKCVKKTQNKQKHPLIVLYMSGIICIQVIILPNHSIRRHTDPGFQHKHFFFLASFS